jgi:hypothetical protein
MKIREITQSTRTPTIQKLLKQHFDVDGTSTINSQGLVDVVGDVRLRSKLTELPVKFGHVSGYFNCDHNQLTSLTGAPHSVGGTFSCIGNQLTSLAGAPQSVGGDFRCDINQLKSLDGAPHSVDGEFSCDHNQLKSLDGAPRTMSGYFRCSNNLLTSLTGAPHSVGGDFRCYDNLLTSLAGAPASIGGEFWCNYSATLPLMRALAASSIYIYNAPPGFNDVMNRHAGLGKRGMMKCASELLTLGTKLGIDLRANCRW